MIYYKEARNIRPGDYIKNLGIVKSTKVFYKSISNQTTGRDKDAKQLSDKKYITHLENVRLSSEAVEDCYVKVPEKIQIVTSSRSRFFPLDYELVVRTQTRQLFSDVA